MNAYWNSLASVLFALLTAFSGCTAETEHRLVGVWRTQGDSNEASEEKLKEAVDDSLNTKGESQPEISITPAARLTFRADGSYEDHIDFWGMKITTDGTWEIVSEEGDQLEIKLNKKRTITVDAAGKQTERSVNESQKLEIEFHDPDTMTMSGAMANGKTSSVEMKRQKK